MAALLAVLIVGGALGWFLYERSRRKTAPMTGGLHEERTLPHVKEWELHHNSFSLCSKKLRVCLDELGIDYESHPVDLIETGSYENVSRHFLAVNPSATVPVLVHRGHPVYESHEQIVYAAERAGKRGAELLPSDPEQRALVDEWVSCASIVGSDPLSSTEERAGHCIPGLTLPIFATMVHYIPYRRLVEGFLFHWDRRRPLLFAVLKLRGIRGLPKLGLARRVIDRSRRDMEHHLDVLGEQLEKHGGPWIAGEHFTLADVSWVVILDRLVEVDWAEHFWGAGRRPAVAAYWERLQARPSYERAIASARCAILLDGIADVAAAKRADPALRGALEGEAPG
jgi:glutathione S-transferase